MVLQKTIGFLFILGMISIACILAGIPFVMQIPLAGVACKVIVLLCIVGIVWLKYFYRTPMDWWVGGLMMLGLAFGYSFFFITDYHLYMNDIDGHLEYIRIIVDTGMLPAAYDAPQGYGWQSAMPPLYYIVAASFYKVGQWIGMQDPFYAARFLSVILYTAFILISVQTLRYYTQGFYLLLAMCLVLFAPDASSYPSRISSDVAMILVHGVVFYFATRWYVFRRSEELRYAWCAALAGFAVKTTVIFDVGALTLITTIAMWKHKLRLRALVNKWTWLAALFGFSLSFGRTLYFRVVQDLPVKWFQNVDKPETYSWAQETTLSTFFYFDVPGYFHYAFPYTEPNGSSYFWNFLLKSILFGERELGGNPALATIESGVLLALVLYIMGYLLLRYRPKPDSIEMVPFIFASCMIGALMMARIGVPWAAQCHIRYIFGLLVILGIYLAKAVQCYTESKRVEWANVGVALIGTFVLGAIWLMVLDQRAFL